MTVRRRLSVAIVTLVSLALPAGAEAAFPGENGKFAYVRTDIETDDTDICVQNPDSTGKSCFSVGPSNFHFSAAWSSAGDKLVVGANDGMYTVDPDGTGAFKVSADQAFTAAWSPSGTQIVFDAFGDVDEEIFVVNADGTGRTRVTFAAGHDFNPAWSPDGSKIAFSSNRDGDYEIYVMNRDGTGQSRLTSAPGTDDRPNWSPDGDWLAFNSSRDGNSEIYKMRPDGSGVTRLTNGPGTDEHPAWAPDGAKVAFFAHSGACLPICENGLWSMNPDGSGRTPLFSTDYETGEGLKFGPDWQPLPVNTPSSHARPKGATPIYASLVPAMRPCTAPNSTHAAPLSFSACNPPSPWSSQLTLGGGTTPAKAIGSVQLQTLGTPGGPDDSDVRLRLSLTNVTRTQDLSDYTGELQGQLGIRLTDKQLGVSSTTQRWLLAFPATCTATPDTTIGATCAADTSAEAIVPGAVTEGARAIWSLDRIIVHDGGHDGDVDTPGNALLATQGVFAP